MYKLPEEGSCLSFCLLLTGRSKSSGGTDKAASRGSEDGQSWLEASEFGTRTSCRIRPWTCGNRWDTRQQVVGMLLNVLGVESQSETQLTENKPFHLPRLPMWNLDAWMLRSEGKALEGPLFAIKDNYPKQLINTAFQKYAQPLVVLGFFFLQSTHFSQNISFINSQRQVASDLLLAIHKSCGLADIPCSSERSKLKLGVQNKWRFLKSTFIPGWIFGEVSRLQVFCVIPGSFTHKENEIRLCEKVDRVKSTLIISFLVFPQTLNSG